MAQDNFIKSVRAAAQGRNLSINWYKEKIKEFGTPKALDLIRDGKRRNMPFIGRLNMFFYDPKFKEKLPYYDTFPLVLPIEEYSDGFLGLNLHYLPIPLRMRLLDRLVEYSTNTKYDETTRLNVSYTGLKNISLIRPTIHKYLYGQTRSDFRRIDADEFTIAALLPVQRFKKSSATVVWGDSRRMV